MTNYSDSQLVWKGKLDLEVGDTAGEETLDSTPAFDIDREWEAYWQSNSQSLILSSWIEKYRDYINPEHLTHFSEEPLSTQNSENSEIFEAAPVSEVDSTWNDLWKTHCEEQYSYYRSWFYEWSATSQEVNSQQSTTLSTDFEVDPIDDLLQDFKDTTLGSNMEPSTSKEQRDKNSLEKTKDFLAKMGFSGLQDTASSCITNCEVITRNRKRKKKGQPVPHVSMDASVALAVNF